jgi:hypothetical protein
MAPSPHDTLLKHAVADSDDIALWLAHALADRPWARLVCWNELSALPTEHPGRHDATRSDAIFLAPLRDHDAVLVLPFEHQTAVEHRSPQRQLGYVGFLVDRPTLHGKAIAIVPIVLYQGHTPWTAPRTLHEALGLSTPLIDAFAGSLPQLTYELLDLVRTPSLLRAPPAIRVALALLREGRVGSDWRALAEHAHLLPEVYDRRGRAYLERLLEYAYEVERAPPSREVVKMIASTRDDIEETFIS